MTLFPETMRTPRLRYERIDDGLDAFERYAWTRASRDGIDRELQYVTETPDSHPKATWENLRSAGEAFDDADYANWAIFLRPGEPDADGDPVEPGERVHVGVASLDALWNRRRAHTGIGLYRPYWGRGYSGERAPALLKVAFERLDLEVASVAHFQGNENSRRAMEKWVSRFGGTEDGYFRNWVPRDGGDDDPWDLRSYGITQAQYRESGGAPEVELDPEGVPTATSEPTEFETDGGDAYDGDDVDARDCDDADGGSRS